MVSDSIADFILSDPRYKNLVYYDQVDFTRIPAGLWDHFNMKRLVPVVEEKRY